MNKEQHQIDHQYASGLRGLWSSGTRCVSTRFKDLECIRESFACSPQKHMHRCCKEMQKPHWTVCSMLHTQAVMLHLQDSKFVATNSPGNKKGGFISQYYML